MRKIIHIDMDCFYAAIEIRDNPKLANQPVAVGWDGGRGVISTCNYIARQYGIRSAMPSSHAKRLCPHLIFVSHHFDKYKAASQQIHRIFEQYTDKIEPLSLDEAFLDVSDSEYCHGSATWLAKQIREEIATQVGITASAGISSNKFIAKIASDWRKPNGQFCVLPEEITEFVAQLPVAKLFGVGKVTGKKLNDLGIYTCYDLKQLDQHFLQQKFGKFGTHLYQLCRGIDHREVTPKHKRKSLSVEHTFDFDLENAEACQSACVPLLEELAIRLDRCWREYRMNKINVKLKFTDFTITTVERRAEMIHPASFLNLVKDAYQRQKKPVRLIGLGVKMVPKQTGTVQLELPFDDSTYSKA